MSPGASGTGRPTGGCPADTRTALIGGLESAFAQTHGLGPFTEGYFVAASTPNGHGLRIDDLVPGRGIDWGVRWSTGHAFVQDVALASTPTVQGLWAGWENSDTGAIETRFLPGGGVFAVTTGLHLPRGQYLRGLALAAQQPDSNITHAVVDVIATTIDADNTVSVFAIQAHPGLSITAGKAVVTVMMGDRTIKGATVQVAGRTLTTAGGGRVRLRPVLPPGSYTVTASDPPLVTGRLHFRVK